MWHNQFLYFGFWDNFVTKSVFLPPKNDVMQYCDFSDILLNWYKTQKRNLPWRGTDNPYYVWLSEIILQQTRVVQGLPYYLSFVENFPTIQDLADATEQQVLKLWQGLGYYSRAKNLHHTAKIIAYQMNGFFPTTYNEIVKLKGIGDYTASAIASICFNEPTAVVDGNVYRVLSRIFEIEIPINTSQAVKYFKELATELLDKTHPGEHNQALMDFGATQCKPQSPDCSLCPFSDKCLALAKNKIHLLPIKKSKINIKNRYFHYCVLLDNHNNTIVEQRQDKDIWQGLYQFPLLEFSYECSEQQILDLIHQKYRGIISIEKHAMKVHKLSHQNIFATFWIIQLKYLPNKVLSQSQLRKLPVPILIAKFLKNLPL